MGLGVISLIKNLAPLVLYFVWIIMFFLALGGKGRWTLLFVIFLLPLRNVVERLQSFPAGGQLIDLLIIGMLLGWLFSSLILRTHIMETSSISVASVILVVYTFISLQI